MFRTYSTDRTSLTPLIGLAFGRQVSRVNDPVISQVLPHVASMEFEGCPTVEATYDDGKVCSEFATVCSLCAVALAAAHRLMKCQFCGSNSQRSWNILGFRHCLRRNLKGGKL